MDCSFPSRSIDIQLSLLVHLSNCRGLYSSFLFTVLIIHLGVRDKIYPNLGTIHDLAYVIGEATLRMNASYRWHDEFAFSEFSKKK